jgi:ATP-GRASP peptide maturase of grasp-with-spasm system
MVLIISRQDDGNTHSVIEWLIAMKKEFVRLNADDKKTKIALIDVDNKKIIVEQGGRQINLWDATSIWHRRKGLSFQSISVNEKTFGQKVFFDADKHHRDHVLRETNTLIDFIYSFLEPGRVVLGNHCANTVNKMEVLNIARRHGWKIPESYIVTRKADLEKILKDKQKGIVTKALADGVYLFTDKFAYYSYTEKITDKDLDRIPEHFFPSLVQVEVKKKFELRVFYLRGRFFAMAIFSQQDKQTAVDFRKYNSKTPNRTVPYLLPETVQSKLREVFAELDLNTGSADLIVDSDGEYVFLEINPVGQIAMTSAPCNYHLEKKIAESL